jgi:Zn-dependent alcohol dehydrogenase
MKAVAAITDGQGGLIVDEIEVDDNPRDDEVLVDIKACGVCHTDWDSLKWGPSILGHEGAGIVRAVGPRVTTVKPGDRVLLNWAIPCGLCWQCVRGNQTRCESRGKWGRGDASTHRGKPLGRSFGIGTMASTTIVREAATTRIHVDLPLASACLLGCGVMTGYGAVINVANVRPGESVAVIGVGGVGLGAVQGARIANAHPVIAVDINPRNLELAKKFGATHVVQAEREDKQLAKATEQVKALTAGRGADYVFEASGVPALSVVPPMAMTRLRGECYLLSNIEHDIAFSMIAFSGDKSFMRPTYGWCRPSVDFPVMFDMYARRQLYLDEMVTTRYRIDEVKRAFDDMFAGKNARGVIVFD